jgi:FkbM family methyltransferase
MRQADPRMASGPTDAPAINRRRGRVIASMLRVVPRLVPLKGWTIVTERLHPYIVDGATDVVHRTREGLELHLDLADYIQRGIFYEAWETPELAFARAILRPGDIMFDVGANVGIFTLVGARVVGPAGQVHAFEPIPANFDRLTENVQRNGFANVVLNQAAAGPLDGVIQLGLEPDMERTSGKQMSGFFTVGSTQRQVTVPVVKLDRYAEAHLPDRAIRFIKVDVEGYEPEVLAGLQSLLSAQKVDILMMEVDVYSLNRLGTTIGALVDRLVTSGYLLYRLTLPGRLGRWVYKGEPAIPRRTPGRHGLISTILIGLQDLERNFNLVAIRGGHPALAGKPRSLPATSLGRTDG